MMVVTWKQQNYTLAGTTTSGYGVFRRYFLCLLLLMVLHFDHIPGKSGACQKFDRKGGNVVIVSLY